MYTAPVNFQKLFKKFKFILPNGGPSRFGNVASGRTDVYVAYRQALIEIFSGMTIAEKAGVVITTFEGVKVVLEDNINKRYDIICSANEDLHREVLEEIALKRTYK